MVGAHAGSPADLVGGLAQDLEILSSWINVVISLLAGATTASLGGPGALAFSRGLRDGVADTVGAPLGIADTEGFQIFATCKYSDVCNM